MYPNKKSWTTAVLLTIAHFALLMIVGLYRGFLK
jgi:hypothetical protein